MKIFVSNSVRYIILLCLASLLVCNMVVNAKTIEEMEAEEIQQKQAGKAAAEKAATEKAATEKAATEKAAAEKAAAEKAAAEKAAAEKVAAEKAAAGGDMNEALVKGAIEELLGINEHETPDQKTKRLLTAICQYANKRSVIVRDGLLYLDKIRKDGRKCMNAKEYQLYSTNDFDNELKRKFEEIRTHLDKVGRFDPRSQPARWAKAVFSIDQPPPQEIKSLNDLCMVKMLEGDDYYMTMRELRQNVEAEAFIADPHATLPFRWGVVKEKYVSECSPTHWIDNLLR